MKGSLDLPNLKASFKVLLSAFLAAFIGAGWVAFIAIQLGAMGYVWLPLSAIGAAAVSFIAQAFPRRPAIGHHLFN